MPDSYRYVLIGGGVACAHAAQGIREHDSEGGILIIGAERHPPYDRPPLSKSNLVRDDLTPEDFHSKDNSFYTDNRVALRTGTLVTAIDRAGQTVTLGTGDVLGFEKLLLATGSTPVKLDVPGADLAGIHTLRTVEDSIGIRTALIHGGRAIVVGAGYIGMEVASACIQRGVEVAVIERANHPWSKFASPATGKFLQKYFAAKGARFLMGRTVTAFSGDHAVDTVTLEGDMSGQADFVVVGIGVTPNTALAEQSGLAVTNDRAIKVDPLLRTSDSKIWAAGDIVSYHDSILGKPIRAEHFLNARNQGRAAGASMAGELKPFERVPYFFSDMLDVHMILRGDTMPNMPTVVFGDTPNAEFVELYHDASERLHGGIAFSHDEPKLDPISDKLEELVRDGVKVKDLSAGTFGL